MKEIGYLARAIKPEQLRSISFVVCDGLAFEKIFVPLARFASRGGGGKGRTNRRGKGRRRKKKNENLPCNKFTSLETIDLAGCSVDTSTRKQLGRLRALRLKDLSPGLRIVNCPAFLEWCIGLEDLTELRFVLSSSKRVFEGIDLPTHLKALSVDARQCCWELVHNSASWITDALNLHQLESFEMHRACPLLGDCRVFPTIKNFVLVAGMTDDSFRIELPACRDLGLVGYGLGSCRSITQSAVHSLNRLHIVFPYGTSVTKEWTEFCTSVMRLALERPLLRLELSRYPQDFVDSALVIPRQKKAIFCYCPQRVWGEPMGNDEDDNVRGGLFGIFLDCCAMDSEPVDTWNLSLRAKSTILLPGDLKFLQLFDAHFNSGYPKIRHYLTDNWNAKAARRLDASRRQSGHGFWL